jgi:signal transduction histidine kinase
MSAASTTDRVDFQSVASAARRVTGSEAVIIALERDAGRIEITSSLGLYQRELQAVRQGLRAGDAGVLEREFDAVLSADIIACGRRLGAIHALRRGPGGFEHEELIDTFATQIGLALAMTRRGPVSDEMLDTWAMLDRLVLSAHSVQELGQALSDVLGPLFAGARIAVLVADRQRGMLQMISGGFGADERIVASHRVSFFDPRSNSARVFTTGLPYLSNASAADISIRKEYVDLFGIDRVLTIPLGQVGVLHIANPEREFGLADLERAEALASRVASIVELATTLFRTRRQQVVEETISRVAVAVASGKSIRHVLPPALHELLQATDASLVAFVPEDAPPIVARVNGLDPDLEEAVIDEAGTDPGVRAYVVGPQKAGDPGRAAYYVPVVLSSTRVGTLAALRRRGEPFTRSERHAFARMANVTALNYATERYQQQRAELARLHERQRLADDLHDDVAQILFAAQLSLDSVLAEPGLSGDVTARIARARGLLIRGDTAIRTVIHRLARPPAADIATRVASVVVGVEEEFSLAIHLRVDKEVAAVARGLRRPASDALVKVAREALVNAAKHAGRCRVSVSLEMGRGDRLLLTVADDGFGARPPRPGQGHGLASLRQLALDLGGELTVWHGAFGGTTVTLALPARSDERESSEAAPSGEGKSLTAAASA